ENIAPGSIKNVSIQNVTATGANLTSSITGVEGGRVQDVIIDGFTLTAKGGGAVKDIDVPEVPAKYPDGDMFGELPALALFTRHVDGLTVRNLKVHSGQPDPRPGLIADDVTRLQITGFESTNIPEQQPLLLFRNVAGALLNGNLLTTPASVYLSVMGSKSSAIALHGNSLEAARKVFVIGEGAPAGSISVEPVRTPGER
ncbi:MAG: hypothetical protein JO022_21785, partial [Acidobacteriaceae bacterium]|nr:hypothetical protein [Acidobacteriaceae bacterium]